MILSSSHWLNPRRRDQNLRRLTFSTNPTTSWVWVITCWCLPIYTRSVCPPISTSLSVCSPDLFSVSFQTKGTIRLPGWGGYLRFVSWDLLGRLYETYNPVGSTGSTIRNTQPRGVYWVGYTKHTLGTPRLKYYWPYKGSTYPDNGSSTIYDTHFPEEDVPVGNTIMRMS